MAHHSMVVARTYLVLAGGFGVLMYSCIGLAFRRLAYLGMLIARRICDGREVDPLHHTRNRGTLRGKGISQLVLQRADHARRPTRGLQRRTNCRPVTPYSRRSVTVLDARHSQAADDASPRRDPEIAAAMRLRPSFGFGEHIAQSDPKLIVLLSSSTVVLPFASRLRKDDDASRMAHAAAESVAGLGPSGHRAAYSRSVHVV